MSLLQVILIIGITRYTRHFHRNINYEGIWGGGRNSTASSNSMIHRFTNRHEAGVLLANHLKERFLDKDAAVIALPGGGLEVGLPVAQTLKVPMQALVVRKLGAPHQPELAIGALATGGFIYLNEGLIDSLHVTKDELKAVKDRESRELLRRESLLYPNGQKLEVKDLDVLLIDDGIATGATIEVAIRALKAARARSLSIAVPVASLNSVERLHRHVEHVFALQTPNNMEAIGDFYESFPQVSDEEALRLLDEGSQIQRREDDSQ